MDSGNSGSMQSSSGGDEQDFDSRAGSESISSFFNPSSHFRSTISAAAPHPPPPPPPYQIQNPTFFDHYNNTNDNHDLIWSRPGLIRSEHHDNYAHFGNTSSSSSSLPIPTSTAAAEGHAGRAPPQASVPKNPKKRTRASRRAPTTVLTTDTTNFRQMVQEFTGIPAAPFSGGSPYPRRMDLFSAASSLRSGGHLGPLLRPSSSTTPPPPPSFLNSSMVDSTNTNNPMSTTANAAAAATALGASTSNNQNSFVLSRDHLLNLQPSMDFGEFLGREIITSSATGQAMRNNNNNININNGDDDDLMRRWRRSNDEGKMR